MKKTPHNKVQVLYKKDINKKSLCTMLLYLWASQEVMPSCYTNLIGKGLITLYNSKQYPWLFFSDCYIEENW